MQSARPPLRRSLTPAVRLRAKRRHLCPASSAGNRQRVNAHPPARCKSRCESTVEARPREEKAKGALDGWTLRTAPSSSAAAERGERDRRVAGKQEGARGICVGGYGAGELKEGIRSAIRWGPTGLPYPTLGSGARPRGGRGPGPRARSTCPLPPVAIALQRRLGDLRLRACVGARRLGGKDGELSALLVLAAAGPPPLRSGTDGRWCHFTCESWRRRVATYQRLGSRVFRLFSGGRRKQPHKHAAGLRRLDQKQRRHGCTCNYRQ